MAIVPTTPKLEKLTAVRLLKLGKATPEQQKLASQYIAELLGQLNESDDMPKRLTSERDRNVMIYRYMQLCEQSGEKVGQKQTCREFAELFNLSEGSVIREFSRWKNQPEEEKQKDVEEWSRKYEEMLSGMFY
ncbi:hypothetical protein BCL93_105127 [Onishia taeanensis]|uniref:Uncharacterized protein n=1 Tax=Onishia taeanensis TaxID=284577 RepID=A0A328XNY7_9GAMM|nr:hypothetical protein [Halomonas taeanensis]RAR61526.1 hypothetical protein BCL93_105127 [Halomonas taeanensis]